MYGGGFRKTRLYIVIRWLRVVRQPGGIFDKRLRRCDRGTIVLTITSPYRGMVATQVIPQGLSNSPRMKAAGSLCEKFIREYGLSCPQIRQSWPVLTDRGLGAFEKASAYGPYKVISVVSNAARWTLELMEKSCPAVASIRKAKTTRWES
jgi:hypothetical protein